ncbi:6-phosphogluconolactonase [Opitutaceae bacterium EW11]|nr:6-phosphogluconolactonase [Opitutaceae bacterium EW11]
MRWNPLLLALLVVLSVCRCFGAEPASVPITVYVGTFPSPQSKGIYSFQFDPATGKASPKAAVLRVEADRPGYLALHPNGRILYSLSASSEYQGKPSGSLTAYSIRPDGSLEPLGTQATGGAGPCYLDIDPTGRCALVAAYNGGNISALPIAPDGRLGEVASFIQHTGSSVNPERQTHAYAHWIEADPTNHRALVCDLGLDKVLVYRLDVATAKLTANEPPSASVAPGSGPRHLAFHPSGKWAYVINEMGNTVDAFDYDSKTGALHPLQTVSTLPEGFEGANTGAEIAVHPNGHYVYASNRGDNSVVVFRIDPASGKLAFLQRQSTGGKTPRFFALDPTGHWLLVANQDSQSIVVLHLDPETGKLSPTNQRVEVGAPTCLVFATLPKG